MSTNDFHDDGIYNWVISLKSQVGESIQVRMSMCSGYQTATGELLVLSLVWTKKSWSKKKVYK